MERPSHGHWLVLEELIWKWTIRGLIYIPYFPRQCRKALRHYNSSIVSFVSLSSHSTKLTTLTTPHLYPQRSAKAAFDLVGQLILSTIAITFNRRPICTLPIQIVCDHTALLRIFVPWTPRIPTKVYRDFNPLDTQGEKNGVQSRHQRITCTLNPFPICQQWMV